MEPDLSDDNTQKRLGAAMKGAKSEHLMLRLNKDSYKEAINVSLSTLNPNYFSLESLRLERKSNKKENAQKLDYAAEKCWASPTSSTSARRKRRPRARARCST